MTEYDGFRWEPISNIKHVGRTCLSSFQSEVTNDMSDYRPWVLHIYLYFSTADSRRSERAYITGGAYDTLAEAKDAADKVLYSWLIARVEELGVVM